MNTTEKRRYPIPDFHDLEPSFGYNYEKIIDAVLNETHIDVIGIPKYLYLYRENKNHIADIIKNQYFYLSRADRFEDQDDCGISKEDFYSFSKKKFNITDDKTINIKHEQFLNDIRTNSFVRSLTSSYKNELMWDTYANNKIGICIEYDIEKYFSDYSKKNLVLFPIIYTNEKYKILPLTISDEMKLEFTPGIINLLAICKSKNFIEEKEWRFFDRSEDGKEERKEPCPISKIYLGPNFYRNPQKNEILNTIKEKNIKFLQTRIENNQIIAEE